MIINIACVIDDGFTPFCGIMLTSLFENNKHTKVNVYVLFTKLRDSNKESLINIAHKYNSRIYFCLIDEKLLKDCILTNNSYISLATYYKLFFTIVLPKNIDKILYIDSDIIINKSLVDLYNTDIDNYALGAVDETLYGDHTDDLFRLSYDSQYRYFNAGVLLLNLKYWRNNNLAECFIKYAHNYPERIKYHDQDVLNAVLHDKWLALDYKWNVMSFAYQKDFYATHANLQFVSNPAIIHYTCTPKPWHIARRHLLKSIFVNYKIMTQWNKSTFLFQGLSVKQAIRCICYAINRKGSNYVELK